VGAIVIGLGGYFLLKPDGNGTDGNNTMVLPEPPAHP